ncbi:hypothetical protein FQN60_008805, partial [Etheostoma spectabile]
MECDILDSLEQLGYDGPLLEEKALLGAAASGLSSPEYVALCRWLTSTLKPLCALEESITSGPDDMDSLRVEMSGLLKELHCPYHELVSGITKGSVRNTKDHLKFLLFLSSELQAAQIVRSRGVSQKHRKSPVYHELLAICKTLNLPEPRGQDAAGVLSQVRDKVGPFRCLYNGVRVDSMARAYQPLRHSLRPQSTVDMAELLAAREDICNVVKTSSGSSRENTACAVNKILMGRVPDRGGRPSEIEAPPPEMPPWQKRQDGGGGRGG